MIVRVWILFILVLSIYGCSGSINTIKDFNDWLNIPGNGCIQSKKIAGIEITIKYLPPSYSALKMLERAEIKNDRLLDSLVSEQNKLVTFLMTLGPDKEVLKEQKMSVMYEGVENYKEYTERMLSMNFFMENYVAFYSSDNKFNPVLSTVENVYELSDSRNFLVAFVSDNNRGLERDKEYVFIYKDPFFKMGNVQFSFKGDDLEIAKKMNVSVD